MNDVAAVRRHEVFALLAVLLLAALLRFTGLAENPPGLFRDELEKGYTAFELWSTGRHGVMTEDGMKLTPPLPFFIEVYEGHDRTSAAYHYLAAPIVGLFGLNGLTTRLPAAIAGCVAVMLTWLLARRLVDEKTALIAALAAAVLPAGVLFSRWAQQGVLVGPLTMAGILLLIQVPSAEERHQRALAMAGAIVMGLAAWAYAPARLAVPMILLGLFWCVPRETWRTHRKAWLTGAAVFGTIWLLLFFFTIGKGSGRLSRVGVFSDGVTPGAIWMVVSNWAAHLDPRFLFISGDANVRHGLPGAGLIGWGGAVLVLAGVARAIYEGIRDRGRPMQPGIFFLWWLLVGPTAAALTREGIPHALRSILMLPALCFLAGYGAGWIIAWKRQTIFGAALLLCVDLGQSWYGLTQLKQSPLALREWGGGSVEALEEALASDGDVHLSIQYPYADYLALFVEQTPPAEYHEQGIFALRTQLVPPGYSDFKVGDWMIVPSPAFEGPAVLVYRATPKGMAQQ